MTKTFDFIVVGGGSAGAVVASRLSEDPTCKVALLEAGDRPPEVEHIPIAPDAMQLNPETDWMFRASAGKCGLGSNDKGTMVVPRGKMLGGSSGINYMAYVRGHPGDFDDWEKRGATGWSYDDVLPYFKKSEGIGPTDGAVIDGSSHGQNGPLGVSVRAPLLDGAVEFVDAAEAAGIPAGDYNGAGRQNANGVVSVLQTTTKNGKRSSTYHAFLEGEPESRENLTIITHAHASRILIEGTNGTARAIGVEYLDQHGQKQKVHVEKEIIISAGAIGSPHLLLLSGVGPKEDLEKVGVTCVVDAPHVGKHLQDHLQTSLLFSAPGGGISPRELQKSLGVNQLCSADGPLPEDLTEDTELTDEQKELLAEAQRRETEWQEAGTGLAASSIYDAGAWYSSGLGDDHSHDIQIGFVPSGFTEDFNRDCINFNTDALYDDKEKRVGMDAQAYNILANPVLPHSEGEITLKSSSPLDHPDIDMNYYDDPHDMKVMVSAMRRCLSIAKNWTKIRNLGSMMIPPHLAEQHQYRPGDEPSDALLEDYALHYSATVYHASCTCRIGDVVDPRLKVFGVKGLRVADASVMPRIVSANTNAASIMIGEKAAEMVAADHNIKLQEFVGEKTLEIA